MNNILIVSENLFNEYDIVESILNGGKEKINIIFSNCKNTIEFIKRNIPDIILIILKSCGNINTQNIIKYIDSNNLKKYNKSVIIYTEMCCFSENKVNNQYILKYIEDIEEFKKLILLINKKYIDKRQYILEKIKVEMEKLNFNFSYIGTKYFLECIFEIYSNKIHEKFSLNRDCYPILSQKYNQSINNIKCNVTHAYMQMLCNCSISKLENYLKIYIGIHNPKKKEVINAILRNIV